MMKLSRIKVAAAALSVSLLGSVFANPKAHASSDGCTQLGKWKVNIVCIAVRGEGLKVKRATASVAAPVGGVTNWELRITFFDRSGNQYSQYTSGYHSGMHSNPKYTITPNTKFREGRVCGSVTENGVAHPGACVSIYP